MNIPRELFKNNIIRHIKLKDLTVKTKRLIFGKFSYKLPARLDKFEHIRFKEALYDSKDIFIIIPKKQKSDKYFSFLLQSDEDYILNIFRSCHVTSISLRLNGGRKYFDCHEKLSIKSPTSDNTRHNRTRPNSYTNIIASNVKASQLKIRKSEISFLNSDKQIYYLRSVRIPENISKDVLNNIEHSFTLIFDRSSLNSRDSELRFLFKPANDLSFLLAEIERLSINENIETDESFPQSGEFEVPWRFVRFYEGILRIFHPNPSKRGTLTPFYFRNSDILRSFEDIRSYIENKSPKLRVQSADGVITSVLNFKEFMSVISQYKEYETQEDIGFGKPLRSGNLSGFTKEVFQRNAIITKSPYLSYLASLHKSEYNILYLLERVIHESGQIDTDEYGYLFVLKKTFTQITLLYENITDSSRSSIIFYIASGEYPKAVEIIRKFLASEIKNKRQKLSFGQIRFNNPCIYQVRRIKHTNLIDWKYNIQYYL